jgi:hypothetical protein
MVCKVISGKSIKGALNYNENKVREGLADCIAAVNFIGEPEQLNFYNKLSRFENLIEKNSRAKTNAVHISLNFDVGEKLDKDKLKGIALTYMDKIGFGQQPYLVYQHHDAAHSHIHIVTTNIQHDGRRISIHNIGKLQSEKARKEIEIQYGLVQAQSKPQQRDSLLFKVDKAIYGKSETKRSISKIVSHVTQRYKFTSLPELNAVLRQYNVVADRGREGMKMFEKNGLVYSLLDERGLKIGVPIKASALSTKPTLKYLEKQFELNKILRRPHKDTLAKIIDSFFHATRNPTKANFCDYMKFYDIEALFREGKEGRVYGLTFIDHKKGVVLNGSDLGNGYSGQVLIQKLQDDKTGEKEKIVVGNRTHLGEDHNKRGADWAIGIPSTIPSLMKAENVYPGGNFHFKRKRKKKKRPSL